MPHAHAGLSCDDDVKRLVAGTDAEWKQVEHSRVSALLEQCDTSEAMHAQRLLAVTQGTVHSGIWHAAGVLADALLRNQTAVGLARVYAPKAHGAWLLQAGSSTAPLRACTLFSSIAALFGLAGQANYSAANACLDALSSYRRVRAQVGESDMILFVPVPTTSADTARMVHVTGWCLRAVGSMGGDWHGRSRRG
jgi:hypothetical protein